MNTSALKPWWQASIDMMPLCVAVAPWGLLCGSLAVQMGLSPLQAQAMSLIVFAGAAQLSGAAMMGAMAPAGSLWTTTFIISSRHLLYSANFRQYVLALPMVKRVFLAFLLTDEMYALVAAKQKTSGVFDADYALRSGFIFYLFWNVFSLMGILLGQYEGIETLGLDFAIAATFIALVMPMITSLATLVCVLFSATSMIITTALGLEQALLISAISAMLAGYAVDRMMHTDKVGGQMFE